MILNGLWISEAGSPVKEFSLPNYSSVVSDIPRVMDNLAPEIKAGRVVEVNAVQHSNAVGLIPKANSQEMRRITDLSRPHGASVNESVPDRHFKFQTLDFAMTLMSSNALMAIVDIRHAYRHVVIRPRDWDLQSFTIGTRCFQDRCLSFGLKIAPEVFTRFTRAVLRIMARKGYRNLMAYLDEFFLVGPHNLAWETFCTLISVLENLGFYIHRGKLILPAKVVKFLGFRLDSRQMKVFVPQDKVLDVLALIRQAASAKWLPLKTWERLVGKLSFIAKAVYGGRTFLRRLIDLTVLLKRQNKRGCRASRPALADLRWWRLFLGQWNGQALILDGQKILAPDLASDASNNAVGAVFHNQVIYQVLTPLQKAWHINEKELFAFLVAVREWGPSFSRKHVKFVPRVGAQIDNTTAMIWINKGTAKSKVAMHMLRELFWLSATQGFRITAAHIPGAQNVIADAASRLWFHRIPSNFKIRQARIRSPQEIDWCKKLSFS